MVYKQPSKSIVMIYLLCLYNSHIAKKCNDSKLCQTWKMLAFLVQKLNTTKYYGSGGGSSSSGGGGGGSNQLNPTIAMNSMMKDHSDNGSNFIDPICKYKVYT